MFEVVGSSSTSTDEAVAFAHRAWRELFAERTASPGMPADLANFAATYCRAGACFVLARAPEGEVIGSIAYRPYDGRFAALDVAPEGCAEVVRLYVLPQLRRAGLGSTLFQRLQQQALACGVRQLYLHTHPFLPGAIGFWERQGFHTLLAEAEPVWQTHHMLKTL